MKIFYRLSDGSYKKDRFPLATKVNCFNNFLHEFRSIGDEIFLYLDNVQEETYDEFRALASYYNGYEGHDITVKRTDAGSSAQSFRMVFRESLALKADDLVYFVEDDYAHLDGAREVLLEGLERSHYVTLYNHPDKYIPSKLGGNPLIGDDGSETTKVFVTPNSYWMTTNSTTMTFATHVWVLREDQDLWWKYTDGSYPQDMKIFLELRACGRSLVQHIPTKATHCEVAWAAHLHGTGEMNWDDVLERSQADPVSEKDDK